MVEIVVDVNFIELHLGYVLKLVNFILEYVRIELVLKIPLCCGSVNSVFRNSATALRITVMKAAALCAYKKLISILRPRRSAQWVLEPRRSLKIKLCDY